MALRIVPLGGLGEIGMNCLVLEQAGRRVMIDCGVTFDDGTLGIETYYPRLDAVLDAPERLEGLVLTHGHEDHLGAVPRLVAALEAHGRPRPFRLWGSPHALALCRRRLDEAHLVSAKPGAAAAASVEENPIEPGNVVDVGPFSVEPFRVTHSIPAATALLIGTEAGTVVHSGDFKLDERPLDGQLTDLPRLRAAGDAGVALLLSDSTNALTDGAAASEGDVADALAELIGAAGRRVVVGLFASNVHRIDGVARAARGVGRRLCLLGRSVLTHTAVAQELGIVRWPSDLLVSPEAARKLPRDGVVYVASGTQGEPRGAMRRIASGTHHELSLEAGDTVLMSSRVIPGNERAVIQMVDALLAQGVSVESRVTHPAIHASGHAHRGELRRFLEAARPRSFIPLHGTRLHLSRHAALAQEVGVADVMILHDGETASLDHDGLHRGEPVVCGRVATAYGDELDEETLRQRRQIGRAGVVFVAVTPGAEGRRAAVLVRGVPRAEEVGGLAARVADSVMRETPTRSPRRGPDLAERVRRAVRNRLAELLGYKPLVEVRVAGE